jgi:AcrR family transcriptional regulator
MLNQSILRRKFMKAEKINLKKEQGAKTKRKLYRCAAKLFQRHHYDDVSVEKIAKAAGITKATFYSHFKSKDELYLSLLAEYTSRVDEEYQAFLDTLPTDMPAADMLLALAGKIADILVYKVGYDTMKIVYRIELSRNFNTEAVKGYDRKLYHIMKDVLNRGFQRGEFKISLTLEELARQFVMAIRGVSFEWCIRDSNFDLKGQLVTHLKLLLDGIMK